MRSATLAVLATCAVPAIAGQNTLYDQDKAAFKAMALKTPSRTIKTTTTAARKRPFLTIAPPPGACFVSCYLPLNLLQWPDMPHDSYWGSRVASELWLTSLVSCMSNYCDDEAVEEGWETLQEYTTFRPTKAVVPPYEKVLAKVNASAPVLDCIAAGGAVANCTLRPTFHNYQVGFRTGYAMKRQMALHNLFGMGMIVLLFVMIGIGLSNRAWAYVSSRRVKDVEGGYISLSSLAKDESALGAYTWYKKHIGTPAVGGYRHLQPAWWGFLSLPTRLEACMIFFYVALNVYFCVIEYDIFYENLYWYAQEDIQIARYLADRTGIMSFYNMVLLWLLAGRNDVVIWLTGWSFQSMNLFHRWAARVATIQAIVHSAGYMYIRWGEVIALMVEDYWATGVYSTIVMCMLLPLSIRPLRAKLYETFLVLHIVLSAIFLVVLYLHVVMFGYTAWVWICVGLWLFDRTLRIGRVLLLNVKAISGPNSTARLTTPDGLIRLSVDTTRELTPRPGDYYFLYSPLSLTPWQNHPFTLASAEPAPFGGVRLHFLIMPLSGWTGEVTRRIAKGAGVSRERVLLEGPYGHQANLKTYDHILLIAGGSGIAAVLPYLATLPARNVSLVWMVRNAEYAADVFAHELNAEAIMSLPVELFVTRQDPKTAMEVLQAGEVAAVDIDADMETRAAPGVHIIPGRPGMRPLVDAALGRLLGGERLAVLACGPSAMMDDLRVAVADSYGNGKGQVSGSTLHYFEEAFNW